MNMKKLMAGFTAASMAGTIGSDGCNNVRS